MIVNGSDPLPPPEENVDTIYGKSYLEWKGWDAQTFAKVTSLEACYFDMELRRAGLPSSGVFKVLEIGFGNGSFLAYAKDKGWDALGTEVNSFLVEMAISHGLKAIHSDDPDALKQAAFDLVVAFDVLEHIPQDSLLEFVASLMKALKPGGLFLARFPNADSPFGLLNQNGDITHMSAIGLGKVRYLARELGVTLVFFGGQAVPVFCGSVVRSLRRFLGLTLFKVVDTLVNMIFFPNDHISFCSSNVVMALQAPSPTPAN